MLIDDIGSGLGLIGSNSGDVIVTVKLNSRLRRAVEESGVDPAGGILDRLALGVEGHDLAAQNPCTADYQIAVSAELDGRCRHTHDSIDCPDRQALLVGQPDHPDIGSEHSDAVAGMEQREYASGPSQQDTLRGYRLRLLRACRQLLWGCT